MSNVSPIPPPPKDGYVGVLTDVQKKQLAAFRLSVTAKDATLKQGDDHEACRFLRSEKWDVDKTTTKYINYLIWRRDNKIDDFPRVQHPRHDFYRKLISHGCHGFDKAGRPIYIEKSGLVDATAICTLCPLDEAYLAHAWMQEYLAERCLEQSTKLERHIETFTTILDLKGCNASHRKALKFTMKFASNDQNYYPERMGSVFIVNAPWIFPVLWNIVKVVLDANTRSKVHVIKGDYKAYLLQHIDADQLPPEYGGECKTCPTSPDCIPVHDITELKANLAKEEEAMELQTVNIPAGKKFEHKVQAAAGAMFGWYFKVNGKDIGFSVEWIPKDKEAEYKDKKPTERNWAEPYARHAADEIAIQGEYTTTEACTVIFTWDNTYSYWSSKEISFSVSEAEIEEDEKSPSQPTVVDTITSGTSVMSVNDDEKAQTKPRSDSTDSDAGGVSFHQE